MSDEKINNQVTLRELEKRLDRQNEINKILNDRIIDCLNRINQFDELLKEEDVCEDCKEEVAFTYLRNGLKELLDNFQKNLP